MVCLPPRLGSIGKIIWGGPIMLLFLCDYAIFYAPIMPLYAHIYAPNYADYAQIMQIMLKLCLIMPIMPKYAVYAKLCNYAKLCPSARARRGRSKWSSLKPPGCTSSLAQYLEAKKNAHTHTHTHTHTHRNALIAMSTIRTPDLLVSVQYQYR